MPLDLPSIVEQMLAGARGPLGSFYRAALPVAQREFIAIAELVQQIEANRLTETITPEDARDQLAMAKLAAASALDTEVGLSLIAAETAINSALAAVSSVFNGLLGFKLL